MNNTMIRRTMDSMSECHGIIEVSLPCVHINLASDVSIGHQHMGATYHRGRIQIASTSESHGGLDHTKVSERLESWTASVIERDEEAMMSPEGINYLKSKASVIKEVDSEECYNAVKVDLPIVEKRYRCKATDRAMGLAVPWYHRGGTSMESSIPCSYGGRALVMKGAEEVQNTEVNSKYYDKVEGQRPMNFIRPVSTDFSSR
ncbi:hypothetical protein BHM03_00023779 [Ensete ventricosum]|nr:hypothetical protein BHM03_00023779 [Ensete ventricosum]